MRQCCGNCRQFIRTSGKPVDTCGAWGNPTSADRAACDFWMPMARKSKSCESKTAGSDVSRSSESSISE